MRIAIATVAIVLLCFAIYFFFFNEREIRNYPSLGTSIVAFGDSLVEGVGGGDGGFVTLLSKDLGVPILNMGKSGDSTESALLRVDAVLAEDPKVVVVLLGGNDYLQHIPKEKTKENLSTVITKLQDRGAIVLLLGVRGGILKDNFSAMYEELAETYDTAYVSDVLEDIVWKKEYMSDTVHPNAAGYAEIAAQVEPVLRKLIE